MARNDLRIWGGLFVTDKNKSPSDRTWELISRFTWQSEQTWLGFFSAQTINTFHLVGGVESVEYLHGATVISTKKGNWGAFTLSSFIIGGYELEALNSNEVFQHEYGHYLQSQALGPFYLSKVAIPSALSDLSKNHDLNPVEQDANIRAFNYFKKYYSSDFDTYDPVTGQYNGQWVWKYSWRHKYANPIITVDWNNYGSRKKYNDTVLSEQPVKIQLYDILMLSCLKPITGIILDGLLNKFIYEQQY